MEGKRKKQKLPPKNKGRKAAEEDNDEEFLCVFITEWT